ncbi:hypothetical protein EYF80_049998 [Liparis tanakae]|uniref:Uncharacterized protein n=1 Tax=Liparis tanakae TaxID=230148 RepID=A0A4Z2FF35_9TELE|nr:hypothetical protein EYF80_049998 [Liparis tanakae]
MEESQWDLKKICFQRRRLTRLDDFVHTYKTTLKALLREYSDSLKRKKKLQELWRQNDTEVVVSAIPSQFKGNGFMIHHSELRTLRPHEWLAGEINFEDYEGIVSFVNVHNTHWKFLYISAAQGSIYLVDPFHTSTELVDSNNAAKRFRHSSGLSRHLRESCLEKNIIRPYLLLPCLLVFTGRTTGSHQRASSTCL